MNEQYAVVITALLTAVVGPVLVTWISRVSKKTAKLPVFPEVEPEVETRTLLIEVRLLQQSLNLLHQKFDMAQQEDMIRLQLRLAAKEKE